jgi:hypothetical protein
MSLGDGLLLGAAGLAMLLVLLVSMKRRPSGGE